MSLEEAVLRYHMYPRPGKTCVQPTKPVNTREDLALAYTPGVAIPCMKIHENEDDSYAYTNRGNLVAVVTNGSAVLGLGGIGAYAAKPVMEGKAVLFKRFADIDVFDIEYDAKNSEEFIRACQLLEPTVGGINLEDVKAPECFAIEETLRKTMRIPIFHDDQHGTSIICSAALLNALELAKKDIRQVKIVFSGSGAAALASAGLFIDLGATPENILLCDTKGVLHTDRDPKDLNPYKMKFLRKTSLRTLKDAMKGADVFVGCSVKGVVTPEMVASMSDRPIVFAMANPDPEISYPDAVAVRKDLIMATGRSDYPNQVNNVLCFPFMFRGALDVRATTISDEMKIAAVRALAALAKEPVPDSVSRAYGNVRFRFGPEYIIPKPFDPRVLLWVSSAVAKAAMASKVARVQLDVDEYRSRLEDHLGRKHTVIRHFKTHLTESLKSSATRSEKIRIVFPEGTNEKILRACQILREDGLIEPILLGTPEKVRAAAERAGLAALNQNALIVKPSLSEDLDKYAQLFCEEQQRRGMTPQLAWHTMHDPRFFGAMMVRQGKAEGYLSGLTTGYAEGIRPLMKVLGVHAGKRLSSVYVLLFSDRQLFIADPTVNIDPSAEMLADIALNTAEVARNFGVEPTIAMLSFTNFGGTDHPEARKVQQAVALLKKNHPNLCVDGEMQADTAVSAEIMKEGFPFCTLPGPANVLIFPNLSASNIAYKLLQRVGGAEAIGPILMGMRYPAHVLQSSAGVDEIVHMAVVTATDAMRLRQLS